jgi:hypothetical protein
MLDELRGIVEHGDWRVVTVKALALGVFLAAVVQLWNSIRIWRRMRTIVTRLENAQREINLLQIQESRLMAELNKDSKVEFA